MALRWVALTISLRPCLRMALMVLAVIIVSVHLLPVQMWRIVSCMMARIVLLMNSRVHGRRRYCSVNVHLMSRVYMIMFHVVTLHFLFFFILFSFLKWMHTVVFVGFAFVVLFLVGGELLPGSTNKPSN